MSTAVTGAVLRKELLTSLRSPRAFGGLFLFIGALIVALWARWPVEGTIELGLRAKVARAIFEGIRDTSLVLLLFLAPAASAGAITLEREADSLELLLVTPMRPATIVLEKLATAVVFLLVVLFATLPVTTSTALLGGVAGREVALTYLAIAVATVGFAAVGVCVSAHSQRTFAALFATYVVVVPAGAILYALFRNAPDERALVGVLANCVICSGLVTLVAVGLAAHKLGQPPPPPPPPVSEERLQDQAVLWLDRSQFPDNLIVPEAVGTYLPDAANAVYEKEIHFEVFGKGSALVRGMILVGLAGALVAILAAVMISAQREGGGPILAVYATFFILLVTPPFAASSISGERERGTLDLLVTTTLTPRQIILGKLKGCLRTPAVLAGLLLAYAPFMLMHGESLFGVARELLVVGSSLVLATTLSLFASAVTGSTLRSRITSYVALVAWTFAPILLGTTLARAVGVAAAARLLTLTPFGAVFAASRDKGAMAVLGSMAGLPSNTVGPEQAWLAPWLPADVAYVALALGTSALLVAALTRGFDRLVARR